MGGLWVFLSIRLNVCENMEGDMDRLSRSKSIGAVSIMAVITGVVGLSVFKSHAVTPSRVAITTAKTTTEPAKTEARSIANGLPMTQNSVAATSLQTPTLVAQEDPPEEFVVHVAGAVKRPGVYHLSPKARNDDAVKAAGGATSAANLDAINLAAKVEDGEQLYSPTKHEPTSGGATTDTHSPALLVKPPTMNTSAQLGSKTGKPFAKTSKKGAPGGKAAKLTDPSQGKVNLNTAGIEELERLPGIGPAMAERVIEWRKENGGFKNAEDLMQVSGIGEKKFAKMQPFLLVTGKSK